MEALWALVVCSVAGMLTGGADMAADIVAAVVCTLVVADDDDGSGGG